MPPAKNIGISPKQKYKGGNIYLMKKEYISPELIFIKVKAQDILSDSTFVDSGFSSEGEGVFGI